MSLMKKAQQALRCAPKEMALIEKAAKLERRSVNQFVLIAALEAAKARIAVEKIPPSSSPLSEEASA